MVAALHLLVVTAIGLIASGATALTSANPDANSLTLVKVGIVTMLLSWLVIAIVAMAPLFSPARTDNENRVAEDSGYRDGTRVCPPIFFHGLGLQRLCGMGIERDTEADDENSSCMPS
jgi:hypothetical protein